MALFFDQDWFDTKLKSLALTRDDVAASLRRTREEIDEIWKDQCELSPNDVSMLARLLKTPADEIVTRAGVATPTPGMAGSKDDATVLLAKLEEMDQRLMRMERALAEFQSMVIATRSIG